MGRARCDRFLDRAILACISAIEIYNKPDFKFREEAFSILMITAWELLLKARIVQQNRNKLTSIYVRETGKGKTPKRPRIKRNRIGNPMTLGIDKCLELCRQDKHIPLSELCIENIRSVMDVRDNAVHFIVEDPHVSARVLQIGTASLKNFIVISKKWFPDLDLSGFNFYLMPIAFMRSTSGVSLLHLNPEDDTHKELMVKNFLKQVRKSMTTVGGINDDDCDYATHIDIQVRRTTKPEENALVFRFSNASDAIPITLSEEDFRKFYPYTYEQLIKELKQQVPKLKISQRFYAKKRELEADDRHARRRLLDPKNPKSSKQTFYSASMLQALVLFAKG